MTDEKIFAIRCKSELKYQLNVGNNLWEHLRSLEVSDREEERWIFF